MKKRILVAVLNWGLGHASRSVPLIKDLQDQGFEPVLASDGESLLFLQKEFPELQSFSLPSYDITYPRNARYFKLHLLKQSFRIVHIINAERKLVEKIISEENIIGIISDNRLGAFSAKIPSVYLTHQLKVLSGSTTFFSSWLHQHHINRFQECWIPDTAEGRNLSGKMSHGVRLAIKQRYLGITSRFQKNQLPIKYDLLVLLSGPEPQRSLLEAILLKELREFEGSLLFVAGRIQEKFSSITKGHCTYCNFLSGNALEDAFNQSQLILCRPGYSSLLDLAILEKKAFFIPTPGQFEQEYLAKRIQKLGIAPSCRQKDFSLEKLSRTSSYSGFKGFRTSKLPKDLFSIFQREED